MNPAEQAVIERPSRKMMVFVDGENLVFRYQSMLEMGYVPRDDCLTLKTHTYGVKRLTLWQPFLTKF